MGIYFNHEDDLMHMESIKISPEHVHESLRKHMLIDGFDFVLDLEKSQGSIIVDQRNGDSYIDLFTFFASSPLGMNHPKMLTDEVRNELLTVSVNKPSNSDIYTTYMAEFEGLLILT